MKHTSSGSPQRSPRTPRDDKQRRHSETLRSIMPMLADSEAAFLGDEKSFNGLRTQHQHPEGTTIPTAPSTSKQPVVMSRFFGAIPPRPASTPPVPPFATGLTPGRAPAAGPGPGPGPPLAAASGYNPAVMTWDCVSHGSSGQMTTGSLAYSSTSSTQSGSTHGPAGPSGHTGPHGPHSPHSPHNTHNPHAASHRPTGVPSLQRAYSLEGMTLSTASGQAGYSNIPVMCRMPSAGKSFADLAETLQVMKRVWQG